MSRPIFSVLYHRHSSLAGAHRILHEAVQCKGVGAPGRGDELDLGGRASGDDQIRLHPIECDPEKGSNPQQPLFPICGDPISPIRPKLMCFQARARRGAHGTRARFARTRAHLGRHTPLLGALARVGSTRLHLGGRRVQVKLSRKPLLGCLLFSCFFLPLRVLPLRVLPLRVRPLRVLQLFFSSAACSSAAC